MQFWLRLFFSSFRPRCFRSGNICSIWPFRWWGGGAILLRTQVPEMDRLWVRADFQRPVRASRMFWKGPVLRLGGRDPRVSRNEVAPEENETRTTKKRTFSFSPCFFPADSRSPPECAPHSKAIKSLTRVWLRLLFPFFRTPRLRSGNICSIWSFRWWGGGAILLRTQAPETDRR